MILQMDADLQHDPAIIPLFVFVCSNGFSLVIGSRFAPGGDTPNFSLYRRFISKIGNFFVRFFGGLPNIHDCTSGYRCIDADLITKCDFSYLSTRGYSFQTSLLCELLRNGARVVEVPIIFPDRIHGDSKLTFQDQFEFLVNIVKIRFQHSEEFIKFCTVGASGVLINMGLYIALTRLLGVLMFLSLPIAIETSILSNFFLNNIWTFNKRNTISKWQKRILSFHIIAGMAGIINYLIFFTLVMFFGVWDIWANLIGIATGTLTNYYLNSIWTWKEVGVKT